MDALASFMPQILFHTLLLFFYSLTMLSKHHQQRAQPQADTQQSPPNLVAIVCAFTVTVLNDTCKYTIDLYTQVSAPKEVHCLSIQSRNDPIYGCSSFCRVEPRGCYKANDSIIWHGVSNDFLSFASIKLL